MPFSIRDTREEKLPRWAQEMLAMLCNADVGPALKQMGGEAVTQGVDRDRLAQLRQPCATTTRILQGGDADRLIGH